MEMMMVFLLSLLLIFGSVAFASKPSPLYEGLSLVISGGLGCVIVVSLNSTFWGLIVFLIYLGGMLVVFGYTVAMATEKYLESWVGNLVAFTMLLLTLLMEVVWFMMSGEVEVVMAMDLFDLLGNYCVGQDWNGVSLLYGCGEWAMVLLGWILFVTILVVLEVIQGL